MDAIMRGDFGVQFQTEDPDTTVDILATHARIAQDVAPFMGHYVVHVYRQVHKGDALFHQIASGKVKLSRVVVTAREAGTDVAWWYLTPTPGYQVAQHQVGPFARGNAPLQEVLTLRGHLEANLGKATT